MSLNDSHPGDAILVWYPDDDVFHERCLLWPCSLGRWVIMTPDSDVYEEALPASDGNGPERIYLLEPDRVVPRDRRPAYRFSRWPDDALLRRVIDQAYGIAAASRRRAAPVEPAFVRDHSRVLRPLEEFLGPRTVGMARDRSGARGPPLRPPGAAAGGPHVWVLSEPVAGGADGTAMSVGTPVDMTGSYLLGEKRGASCC